jgi:hypothetical protein
VIIKLHGTSGAGKSTIAWTFLKNFPVTMRTNSMGKVEAYQVDLPGFKRPLYILGKYTTQCGGCDTLNADEQISLLHKYAPEGHVLYEGLLASEYYGRLGEASAQYGDNHVFAFLDTPIEVCIERIKGRRFLAGNTKPLNEENTRGRVKKIEALKRKLKTVYGRRVVDLDYVNGYSRVYAILKDADDAAT